MCGIAGIVSLKSLTNKEYIKRKLDKAYLYLKSRGPDEKGTWNDQNTYFLHTRLKILDLKSTASQPMEYGNFIICYNGEIYNFRELKNTLQDKGYSFKSSGDTEVLIAGWKYWGQDILNKLDGMFAFSIWDKKNKVLFLARDRFGKKPLVFSFSKNTFAFASDVRSLKEISDGGQISSLAIKSLFRFRFIYEPLTIYDNFKKLPAGSFLKFNFKGYEIKDWFKLNNKVVNFDEGTNKTKILELTTKAVEKRLISDAPIGVFLSGGIDSGIISACLANINKKIPHFTVGFKNQNSYYDELQSAKTLTKYFGFEHKPLYLDVKKIKPLIDEIIETCDEPFADSSTIPTFMIAKETSHHIKVALSGDGGDEVFGGYRKYLAYRWNYMTNFFPDFIKKLVGQTLSNFKDNARSDLSRKLKRLLLNSDIDINKMQINFLDQLSNYEYKELFGEEKMNLEEDIFNDFYQSDDDLNQILARDMKLSLCGDMLVKLDRSSMRHGLEVRSPFLDKDLVDFAFSVSGRQKIGFFSGKNILRKAFIKKFPKGYLQLPKKGFEVPLDKWLLKDLKYLIEQSSTKKVLESLGIQNKDIVDKWKKDFFAGKSDNSWKLWTLTVYAKWAEHNKSI
tara:strand:- start:615 stop:2474 length:1860 start_codon:yes stop_codon:yes gene_type:complete